MTTDNAPRAGRREWVALGVLALPTLLLALDLSVLFLALPHLSADLDADGVQQLWITDIYGFMIAAFLVAMGTLGDRIGRRRLLLIGATVFAMASVLAAYSTNAEMLIVTRALLGVAGATLMPSTLALISNLFRDTRQRSTAIAVWTSCFVGGTAIGPVVGGVLLEYFWWGSVFLIGVPVMMLLLVAGPLLLPEYRDTGAGRADPLSVGLSIAAILPAIYGLKELAKDGPQATPLLAIVVGTAVGVVFVRRQRVLSDPLLDLRLFSRFAFSAALAVMLLAMATMGGLYFLVTQYLQMVAGLSPLRAGLWLVPTSIAMIAGALLAPPLTQRIGPGNVIAGGLAIGVIGLVLVTQVPTTDGLALVLVGFAMLAFGVGPTGALSTDLVVGSAPPNKAGSASAMSETSGEFGVALGVATLGSVLGAIYRDRMADALPADVPAQVAAHARESIADAVTLAPQVPELLAPAREAFTAGLNVTAGVAAAVFAALAVVAAITFRRIRLGTAGAQAGAADGASAATPTR